jgi:hypothetical protein
MGDEDDATLLIRNMGYKPDALTTICNSEVNNLRFQIIMTLRRICLAQVNPVPDFPFQQPPDNFRSYIFSPIELNTYSGLAQLIQNTGFLLCFVKEHPDVLVIAILNHVADQTFSYLVNCTLPSIFGYYSSREHLEMAVIFYHSILDKAPDRIAVRIIGPLLRSPINFPFIDRIFDIFFPLTPGDPVAAFGDCVAAALPLLPRPVLSLFRHIQSLKWLSESPTSFFVNGFLAPVSLSRISTSPYRRYLALLKLVVSSLRRQFSVEIDSCQNSSGLPYFYECFEHHFLEFFVSVHDCHLLAKVLQESKLLPETVPMDDFLRVPPHTGHYWYACRIYPRGRSSLEPDRAAQVFRGSSPEVQLFEKLIECRYRKGSLTDWLALVQGWENAVVAPFIAEAAARPLDVFLDRFHDVVLFFHAERFAIHIWLALVEANLGQWISELPARLDHLNSQFRGLSEMPAVEVQVTKEAAKRNLAEALAAIGSLKHLTLFERFNLLLSVMRTFHILEKRTTGLSNIIFAKLIQKHHGDGFLSTFVVLNNFGMRIHEFAALCNDEQRKMWLKLEQCILIALNNDMVFLIGFITIQDTFWQIAAQHIH